MPPASNAIEAGYRYCGRMSREAGSSFHAGFVLLPREKRRAMNALYAFMRHTDDLADNPGSARHRGESLRRWRAALRAALDAAASGERQTCESATSDDNIGQAILPALVHAVRRFHVPPEHLFTVIDGVEMDLTPRRYETFDDLREYCSRVASAVGMACIHVWGFSDDRAIEPAQDCGLALQLTNILRDVSEDAREDRVYLPLEDLRQCDYSIEDLKAGVRDERFLGLMRFEIERAQEFYHRGSQLMEWLEPDGRRIFGLIMTTYRSLLDKIERSPSDVFTGRVRVGRTKKLLLGARWMLLPPHRMMLT